MSLNCSVHVRLGSSYGQYHSAATGWSSVLAMLCQYTVTGTIPWKGRFKHCLNSQRSLEWMLTLGTQDSLCHQWNGTGCQHGIKELKTTPGEHTTKALLTTVYSTRDTLLKRRMNSLSLSDNPTIRRVPIAEVQVQHRKQKYFHHCADRNVSHHNSPKCTALVNAKTRPSSSSSFLLSGSPPTISPGISYSTRWKCYTRRETVL